MFHVSWCAQGWPLVFCCVFVHSSWLVVLLMLLLLLLLSPPSYVCWPSNQMQRRHKMRVLSNELDPKPADPNGLRRRQPFNDGDKQRWELSWLGPPTRRVYRPPTDLSLGGSSRPSQHTAVRRRLRAKVAPLRPLSSLGDNEEVGAASQQRAATYNEPLGASAHNALASRTKRLGLIG